MDTLSLTKAFKVLAALLLSLSICNAEEVLQGKLVMNNLDSAPSVGEAASKYIILSCDGVVRDQFSCEYMRRHSRSVSIFGWFHHRDAFVGRQRTIAQSRLTPSNNIVVIDTDGQVTDTLHNAALDERLSNAHVSKNDSLLVFTTEAKLSSSPTAFFFGAPFEPISLIVLEVKSKSIVHRVDSLFSNYSFSMAESPWSPAGKRITYAVHDLDVGEPVVGGRDLTHSLWANPEPGVFVYSLEQNEHIRIADTGFHPIWSPDGDKIAYLTDEAICVYDVDTKSTSVLYKAWLGEIIRRIHWTPCSKYIHVVSRTEIISIIGWGHQRLIRVETGEEVDFVRLPVGYNWFSWR